MWLFWELQIRENRAEYQVWTDCLTKLVWFYLLRMRIWNNYLQISSIGVKTRAEMNSKPSRGVFKKAGRRKSRRSREKQHLLDSFKWRWRITNTDSVLETDVSGVSWLSVPQAGRWETATGRALLRSKPVISWSSIVALLCIDLINISERDHSCQSSFIKDGVKINSHVVPQRLLLHWLYHKTKEFEKCANMTPPRWRPGSASSDRQSRLVAPLFETVDQRVEDRAPQPLCEGPRWDPWREF